MTSTNLFVPLVGQYDNIGDVILRRELVRWLEKLGRLNVYVGRAPDNFVQGLSLPVNSVVHFGMRQWLRRAVATKGPALYVAKPGEVQFDLRGLKEHVGLLPLMVMNRLAQQRGSLRVGVGVRAGSLSMAPVAKAIFRLSDLNLWRDEWTTSVMGFGSTMPDLAFGQGSSVDVLKARLGTRNHGPLVVSYRGDRPALSDEIVSCIRRLAEVTHSSIVCVSQVERDGQASKTLAARLGGVVHAWSADYVRHEEALRGLYATAKLVLSDRLHVLIAAATEGASVACLTDGAANVKISNHFATVGLTKVAVGSAQVSNLLPHVILSTAPSETSTLRAVDDARRQLSRARDLLEWHVAQVAHKRG